MTGGEKDGVAPSWKAVAEGEATSRKKLIDEGGPHQPSSDEETSGDDRPTGIVSEDEETGHVDPLKGK